MPKVDPYKAPLPLLPTRLELPLRTRIIALSSQKSSIPVQNPLVVRPSTQVATWDRKGNKGTKLGFRSWPENSWPKIRRGTRAEPTGIRGTSPQLADRRHPRRTSRLQAGSSCKETPEDDLTPDPKYFTNLGRTPNEKQDPRPP